MFLDQDRKSTVYSSMKNENQNWLMGSKLCFIMKSDIIPTNLWSPSENNRPAIEHHSAAIT